MGSIAGYSVLVTGGGSGIGEASAAKLAADGAHVTICGRTEEKLVAAAGRIGAGAAEGTRVEHIVADVPVEADVEAAVEAAAALTSATSSGAPPGRPQPYCLSPTAATRCGE